MRYHFPMIHSKLKFLIFSYIFYRQNSYYLTQDMVNLVASISVLIYGGKQSAMYEIFTIRRFVRLYQCKLKNVNTINIRT